MNSKERFLTVLNHRNADRICVDFGSTTVTGMHVKMVEEIRRHYGLDDHPIKVVEVFQMLGEVAQDMRDLIGVDIVGAGGLNSMFGYPFADWKEYNTPWGQKCLVPGGFTTDIKDEDGAVLMFPEGDTSARPSGRMVPSGYFYDAIVRQEPIDESKLNVEDNLEEFSQISNKELNHIVDEVAKVKNDGKGVIGSFGGTALGDIALVPAMQLKNPKGIRDIAEWYMSSLARPDYVHAIFEKQTDTAIENLRKIHALIGEDIQALNICGTDFGTQDSQFCSAKQFESLYMPYYKKITGWIHENTSWKVFKHSCGAVVPLMESFIESGFDCINPVQINAKDMSPRKLKDQFGDRIVFWGGGINTQTTLMFGKPQEVKDEVKMLCDIFGENGGFVFNAVHNVQANVPTENVIAMIDAIREVNKL